MEEVEMITKDFQQKQKEVLKLSEQFEKDIPNLVFEARDKRRIKDEEIEQNLVQHQSSTKIKKGSSPKTDRNKDKPSNKFYCINVNSKYKN